MTDPRGVALLPASGEWVYDPLPHRVTVAGAIVPQVVNGNADPARTDYAVALDQLQARYPGCTTVALVVAWFGNATDVTRCAIYPATTYPGGTSEVLQGGVWTSEPWRSSGLTQASPGLIALSAPGGSSVYGGTPSDAAVVRCIRDLKARGLRVTFYPFLLMDCAGYPWRGRIGWTGADSSTAAAAAVAGFLATPAQFSRDPTNLTVAYAGAPTDWTFRRMILHYANLCVVAGGVDLFLLGSEFRGLEAIRGPAWNRAGSVAADGTAAWDYPFVAGLTQLAADVRAIFDAAGLPRDRTALKNLIAYSADWSDWMGVQHADAAGQWPHLDALYAHPAIDFVSFDNYLPLSDWTTGTGGLDAVNWTAPAPTTWPPPATTMNDLGLAGAPSLTDKAYLKANIEGGERFSWFYADSSNAGRGPDPNGSDLQVSRPNGDRLAQARSPYAPDQQLLAAKQLRWWWAHPHRAIYDAGDGLGWAPHGPPTAWIPQSKSITFAEFGFPTCDRATNQPNVFYDPKSSESFTPYWSVWEPAAGDAYRPRRDDLLARLALESVVEYWTSDGHNAVSASGVPMVEPTFMAAWNWDARPFPLFPQSALWGDAPNWPTGTWLDGKSFAVAPSPVDPVPVAPAPATFPGLSGQGWSVQYRPTFVTDTAAHVTGRESRAGRHAAPLWQIDLVFDLLHADGRNDFQVLAGFYAAMRGAATPFLFSTPPELGQGAPLLCRFAEDTLDAEEFADRLFAVGALTLLSVRG